MKRFLLLLIVLTGWVGINAAQASPWPRYSFRISICLNPGSGCTQVQYQNPEVSWQNIPETLKSAVSTTQLTMFGIHCGYGGKGNFVGCVFYPTTADNTSDNGKHAPGLVNETLCQTTKADNWVLANQRACEPKSPWFGYHGGAKPGAECALLGKNIGGYPSSTSPVDSIDTPFGILSASQVANSGNAYCNKADTVPPEPCDITIQNGGLLDHGVQAPTSTSERTLDVTIACGANPNIKILEPIINLNDNRIQSKLTLTRNGSSSAYLLKSVLTSTNAAAGSYSGSTVVIVAPL